MIRSINWLISAWKLYHRHRTRRILPSVTIDNRNDRTSPTHPKVSVCADILILFVSFGWGS